MAPPFIKGIEIKPRLGQGRAGIKCKKPQVPQTIDRQTNYRKCQRYLQLKI